MSTKDNRQKIIKAVESCKASDEDNKRLINLITKKLLADQWTDQVLKLIDAAKQITRVPEARFVLLHEWLSVAVYGRPTPEEMEHIRPHLDNMRRLTSNMGKDSTAEERNNYESAIVSEMIQIKAIHPGYYYTIQVQSP